MERKERMEATKGFKGSKEWKGFIEVDTRHTIK